MDLVINNHIIREPIYNILKQVKSEIHSNLLNVIQDKGSNISITCPFHNNGLEKHPSCQVYADYSGDIEPGVTNCFACHKTCSLAETIGYCFGEDENFGKEWLVERFGDVLNKSKTFLPKIELSKQRKTYLDESILDKFNYYHPYMEKRKLTKEIINKFKIGFDKNTNCIVFPVYDEHDKLLMLTKRSVIDKNFYIDKDIEKPVYALNMVLKENIKKVFVVESQINCLTLWGYGYPAVALFGTGSKHQYDILKRSGIRNYILCFDGDEAGRKGAEKFKQNIGKDVLITDVMMYPGKDVNDLTREEFENLLKSNII